jgi:hypothetical protein
VTADADRSTYLRTLPNTCRCGARWSGNVTAHCAAACHRSFSGVTNFDRHRRNGACLNPANIGMAPLSSRQYECWGYPTEEIT